MQRCLQCQFPVAHGATMCGWCGAPVRGGLPSFLRWLTPRRAQPHPRQQARAATSSSLVGIPGMHALITDLPGNSATTMPAANVPGPAGANATVPSPYAAANATKDWQAASTFPPATTTMTSVLPFAPTPSQTPPPPYPATSPIDRWWPAGLLLLPLCIWLLVQHDQFWSDALQTTTRLCFMGGAVIGGWLLYRRFALGHAWQKLLIPTVTGLMVVVFGGLAAAFVQPAALWQGQQAEQRGDYAQAIAIYGHDGDTNDVARAQIAWGNHLIDQDNYLAAKQHLNAGLTDAVGQVREDGHAALGRLYWQWGQRSLQQGQIADARAEWTLATVQAAGTTAGNQAAAALAAPQNVTGHVIWLGQPLPALQVALISSWSYSATAHSLQSSGDRLEATTNADGSFTITDAKPGTIYALIWVGTFGDTTRVDAQGNPMYTVKAQSLASTNIGTIDIGAPPAPASKNNQT